LKITIFCDGGELRQSAVMSIEKGYDFIAMKSSELSNCLKVWTQWFFGFVAYGITRGERS
jgi:hypothetical protein